jgi:hypothetical protein
MNSFAELFKKENMSEFVLVIVMCIYLVMGFKTPNTIAVFIDTLAGKIGILLCIVYLFLHANPILAVIATLVAFDLMRRSTESTGLGALQAYAPSEKKKMSYFSASNQFPYTLEQEVVAKMAPLVRSGISLTDASYKPVLEDLHDASPLK